MYGYDSIVTPGLRSPSRSAADSTLARPMSDGAVQDLALEVGEVDPVAVDDAERADPRGREIERGRAAEPAGADEQHAGLPRRS